MYIHVHVLFVPVLLYVFVVRLFPPFLITQLCSCFVIKLPLTSAVGVVRRCHQRCSEKPGFARDVPTCPNAVCTISECVRCTHYPNAACTSSECVFPYVHTYVPTYVHTVFTFSTIHHICMTELWKEEMPVQVR